MELREKWKEIAKRTNGRVVSYHGHKQLYLVKGLFEIEHGDIPEHIRKYHLSLPGALSYRKIYLLDIETCGLSHNSPINLVTIGGINGEFIARTFFPLDYSGERGVLNRTLNLLKKADIVFTYNGTAFDLERLSKRMGAYGMFKNGETLKKILEGRHCDLYPIVEEFTRKRGIGIPDRKLQTLEKRLFKSHREQEIRGEDIPKIYHSFVYGKNGEPDDEEAILERMARVINHNVLDVASMGSVLEFLKREGYIPHQMESLIKESTQLKLK